MSDQDPRGPTHESYWMASSESTALPPLDADLEVDAVVIGGGIAGLCTAWELQRAGVGVALLEADRIGTGVTGYTTAKLTALHTLIYAWLREEHGPEGARLYAQSHLEAIEHAAALCAELGTDADLERVPAYTYVESARRVEEIRAEAEAAREAGLPASFVKETGLPYPVAGAVRVEDQLQFHPRKFLLALAHGLTERGGRIFEHTRAVGLHDGTRCRITTESGAVVVARDAVVATHYPVFDRSMLFARLKPRRELVAAAAVPAERAPAGMYITPEQHTRSVRSAPLPGGVQRLLIVTGESFEPGTGSVEERYSLLTAWIRGRFPEAEITYRWAAQDNDTTDRLPYVGHFHPGTQHVYVATGFGGWGMSGGVMSGRLLASHIAGGPRPAWTELYDPRRLPRVRDAGPLLKQQAFVAKHFVGDRLHTSHVDSAADIPPGSGAVVRAGGHHCAAYRDDSGAVTAVDARCTHLGCLVHFDDAEQVWECPCHGSRFATDGSVLHGPATRPLEAREIPESPQDRESPADPD
ncbi:FAD-dependent oxidoreductase [Streptomyces sp. 8N616]|uniref:FAD-dependent oxidoreductase n=1 Tax=Streptomyces sp. 8N616 TaxID=3457414 RepID=UPI003FD2B276